MCRCALIACGPCGVSASAAADASVLTCRKKVLPLINKRWARVLRGPSHAWRVVSFGNRYGQDLHIDDAHKLLNATEALAWFQSRAG